MTILAAPERTPATRGRRPWVAPVAVGTVLAGAAAYTALRDPYAPGFFPPCIFYATTGHYCAGCGGLRATHSLLNGDLGGALAMNPIVTLVVIPLTVIAVGWWLLATLGVRVPSFSPRTWVVWTLPVLLMVFWVVRNIPAFAPYLSPP